MEMLGLVITFDNYLGMRANARLGENRLYVAPPCAIVHQSSSRVTTFAISIQLLSQELPQVCCMRV